MNPTDDQPAPRPGKQRVVDYVLKDINFVVMKGLEHYGTYLEAHNGRDALMDAYQEAIDMVFYLRQAIIERDGK
jgi:hypothetical protein